MDEQEEEKAGETNAEAPDETNAEPSAAAPAERSRRGRAADRLRRLGRPLAGGLPVRFVAALAALVLIAILFLAASREPVKPRGYSELTLLRRGCLIDKTKDSNAVACQQTGPRTYRLVFSRSLKGSTPIASRGSCCPGAIGASIDDDRDTVVIVALGRRVKSPIRASVLVP